MKCFSCGDYFKHHAFNRTNQCDYCIGCESLDDDDDELQVEIELLRNKSGRTQAYIEEDRSIDNLE